VQHDVAIVGAGPAALAAAVATADRGLRTVLLADQDAPWAPNYGGWVDELEGVGLGGYLGPIWSDALLVLGEGDVRSAGRRYARVAKRRLRAALLERCAALGVEVRPVRAHEVTHDATGSTVRAGDDALRVGLVIDASGHKPVFVRRAGEPTAFQAAVGFLGRPAGQPFDAERMTFMDLRTDHVDDELGPAAPTFLYTMPLSPQRVFVEETSLVRAPAVPFGVLLRRLRERLRRMDVVLDEVESTEMCLIPMDTPLPDLDQRVVGFGGAASMVHPASGYLLGRVFGTAPELAATVADGLGRGTPPAEVARRAWRTIWTDEDLRRRELHLFGTRILAGLDADEQRRFFSGFFAMPRDVWAGYLAARGDVASVVRAMSSMLWHSSTRIRWKLLLSGARRPGALLRAAV
jgi:lycopene cyclase-like protein